MSQVLTPTITIPRGGKSDVQLQFTIPFVDQHAVFDDDNGNLDHIQSPLSINIGVHNTTGDCEDLNQNACDTEVFPYMKHEADKYNTDDWKIVHNITVRNTDNGGYSIDKHLTLRLETGVPQGNGSRIFEKLNLPDIQVMLCIIFLIRFDVTPTLVIF